MERTAAKGRRMLVCVVLGATWEGARLEHSLGGEWTSVNGGSQIIRRDQMDALLQSCRHVYEQARQEPSH